MENIAGAEFRRLLRAVINAGANEQRPLTAQAIRRVTGAGIGSVAELEAAPLDPTLPPEAASCACWLLGALKTGGAETALLAALHSAEGRVRAQAAISLATLRSLAAVDSLLELLPPGRDAEMRSLAVYALGEIGDERATEPLLGILVDEGESAKLRAEAADALATLGAREAVPELLRCLESEAAELRFWAVHALGKLGTAAVLPPLRRIAEHDRDAIERWGPVAVEAREAIEHIEWREARWPEEPLSPGAARDPELTE